MTNNSIELLASSIPVRLTVEERSLQKLLCSALDVSEYTNRVDEVYRSRDSVIKECLYDLYKTILGLNINASKETGKKLLLQSFEGRTEEEGMSQCAEFFAGLFEIGRRYKRMNPDKMRSEYGKLISLMQDAVQLKGSLQMNIHKPIVSVYDILKNNQLLGLLDDENLPAVTSHVPISETDQPKSELIKQLSDKYSEGDSNRRNIAELCIRSLDDGQCFLRDNAESLTALIGWLKHYFHPTEGVQLNEKYGDISISRGREGSKLSHSHNQHYYYVLESLTLWQCIMSDVFNLWSAAEEDMLDERCSYRMRNTGQGVHRLKQAPRTAQVMRNHIGSAQHKMGGKWVGSQIVHLGDDDVPNALVFIDKYMQVPRIINPIVQVIRSIDHVATLPGQNEYIERKFGSVESCKAAILQDLFKHGFDGSGDDGGSCIDGRLTSAWNWCSRLHKKPFYHTFLLAGFQSFDGQW